MTIQTEDLVVENVDVVELSGPSCPEATSRRRFLRNAILGTAGVALSGMIAATPADAGGLFAAPSVSDQRKVGLQAADQILKKYKEVHDQRATHFQEIGRRLVGSLSATDRKNWDFKFHVLDSKDVNAFALPGGPMFLFTGLYSQVSSDDALAGVTGHEMTHVRMQHWAKAYEKDQERQLGIAALLSILRAGNTVQTLAGLANNAISLKFSRGEEQQADDGGLQNMIDAGYNPQGMIELFQVLQKISGNGGGIGGDFLSDHPLTSTRIKHAEQKITGLQSQYRFPALTPLKYSSLVG